MKLFVQQNINNVIINKSTRTQANRHTHKLVFFLLFDLSTGSLDVYNTSLKTNIQLNLFKSLYIVYESKDKINDFKPP